MIFFFEEYLKHYFSDKYIFPKEIEEKNKCDKRVFRLEIGRED